MPINWILVHMKKDNKMTPTVVVIPDDIDASILKREINFK